MRPAVTVMMFSIGIITAIMALIMPASAWGAEGGTRPLSMGGAFVALADDVHAVSWNPAGLAWLEDSEVTVSVILNNRGKYISGDFISDDYLAAAMPLKAGWQDNFRSLGGWGAYLHHSVMEAGGSRVRLYQPGVSYGTKFPHSETMAWGIALNYYAVEGKIPGARDSAGMFGVSAAYLWYVLPQFSLGFLWENINEPSYSLFGNSLRMPRILRPGIAYYHDERTVVTLELYDATGNTRAQGADCSQNIRLGFERYAREWLAVRLGVHHPGSEMQTGTYVSAGIGLERSDYMGVTPVHYYLDYSIVYWPESVSGMQKLTHQIGITSRF